MHDSSLKFWHNKCFRFAGACVILFVCFSKLHVFLDPSCLLGWFFPFSVIVHALHSCSSCKDVYRWHLLHGNIISLSSLLCSLLCIHPVCSIPCWTVVQHVNFDFMIVEATLSILNFTLFPTCWKCERILSGKSSQQQWASTFRQTHQQGAEGSGPYRAVSLSHNVWRVSWIICTFDL